MRSEILISLMVVALCAGAVAAEQPVQPSLGDILILAAEDPNVPPAEPKEDPNNAWDPAEHFLAQWESISVNMTSRLYNPAVRPDVEVEGPQWSLSLASTVEIIDSNGLIGRSRIPSSVRALDQEGRVVASSTATGSFVRWYQQPTSLSLPPGFPSTMHLDRFSLSLPMEPNAVYPEVLSRVEWNMNVLLAEESKTVDVPFKANETWVELTPGMEILVEQATVEEARYQYRVKLRYDGTQVANLMSGSIHLWHDDVLPPAAVVKMDVLNAEGQSIRSLGGGGFGSSSSGSGSNNQWTGTMSGSGSCAACGTATTLRYTIVFNMYEREVRFALENVPVPNF